MSLAKLRLLGFIVCASCSKVPAPTAHGTDGRLDAGSPASPSSSSVTAAPATVATASASPLGTSTPTKSRAPSFALLREFADGKAPAEALIDADRGVAFVTVGPEGGAMGQPKVIDEAKRHCGKDARQLAVKAIRAALANGPHAEELDEVAPCTPLACTRHPRGEWDSETTFGFRRTKEGTLALDSVVTVLDVPVRAGAEHDAEKAARHVKRLDAVRCATKP